MDTIKRIEISNTNRWAFSNAIHSRFQKKMYEIVMSDIVPTSTLNIKAELLSEWKAYVDLELDHNREVKSSALTKVLQYKDKTRVQLITHLFNEIRTQVSSPIPDRAQAAAFLIPLVSGYSGLQRESMGDRTIHLHGLMMDLDKAENLAYVNGAGIQDAVEALRQANADFEEAFENRESGRIGNISAVTRKLRAINDEYFKCVCILIEAAYLSSSSAEDMAAMELLALTLNHHINVFRTAHNQSMGQKRGAGAGTGTSGQSADIPLPSEGDSSTPEGDSSSDTPEGDTSSNTPTGDNTGDTPTGEVTGDTPTGDNSGGDTSTGGDGGSGYNDWDEIVG